MQVDLTPVLQTIAGIVTIALGTVGSWALTKLAQKLGVQQNAAVMANLNDAAMKSISAAVMASQDVIKAKGWDHPEVQNQLVAIGAQFVADKFKDTLAQSGIDPATEAGKEAIHDLVNRALPAGTAAAASSPTTPPVPDEQKVGAATVVPPATVIIQAPAAAAPAMAQPAAASPAA